MLVGRFVCLVIALSCVSGLPVKPEKPKEPEQTGDKPDSPTQNLEVNLLKFSFYRIHSELTVHLYRMSLSMNDT